jgi:hypothetical protein
LGEPAWLLDGILRHDTFAREGREAFAGIPYLAPLGFSEIVGFDTEPIVPGPVEWNGEVKALEIQGAPKARDTALLHIPSRTLILTELIFNFENKQPVWDKVLLRIAIGREHHPGMSRSYRAGIKDENAFQTSMTQILNWEFERIIVGHGDMIQAEGKAKLRLALEAAGF